MYRSVSVAVLILLLSGCGSTPQRQAITLGSAPQLPDYRVGDTFIFSDGSVEKVVGIRGERVEWESRGGAFRYTSYRNFIVPKLQWESEERRVTLHYSGDHDLLWPLQQGRSAYLSTIVSVSEQGGMSAKQYLQSWRCQVEGGYRIEVAAGTFDTQRVECQRTTLMGRWMQTRIWYYAPAVGHYVLREDEYAPTNSRRHIERRKEQHFQQAMEQLRSGEESEWRDEADRYSRKIRLLRSFRTAAGQYCRDYQMARRDDGRMQHYQGSACRGGDGQWRIAIARPGAGRGA
jgi:hypothetical protein